MSVIGYEKDRGGIVVGGLVVYAEIITQDPGNHSGVRFEHHLLMCVEPPTQTTEVDDDHAFSHDRRPFAARGGGCTGRQAM
jgi:hypothetical protein